MSKVLFSNGEEFSFSSEEIIEYGLYYEDKVIDDFYELCTTILAKRMMTANASYVLFSNKTKAQIKKRFEVYINEKNTEEWSPYYEGAVYKALERLEELGYIDDVKYANRYAYNALIVKCASKNSVLNELIYKKGISKEIAECEVNKIMQFNEQIEADNIHKLLNKKLKGKYPDNPKEFARIYRYAIGKGFTHNDIENALNDIKLELEDTYE